MNQTDVSKPGRCPNLAAWTLALAVLAAVLANAYAYMAESQNPLEVGAFAGAACLAKKQWLDGQFLGWLSQQNYYPPLYYAWLAAFAGTRARPDLASLVMWSNVLVAAGFLGLAGAMIRRGAGALATAVALCFLAGSPLVNIHTKSLQFECGVLGIVGLVLWLLAGPEGLPSRRKCALLGAVGAAGLLTKWTVGFYLIGPVLVAIVVWFRAGGTVREAFLRLTLVVVVALVLAGPWYAFVLDWDLLRQTTENDATVQAPPGLHAYLFHLSRYLDSMRHGLGAGLMPLVLLGLGLVVARHPPGTALFLSSALGAMAVLPVFRHAEPRYLVPLMPALAAGAALGFTCLRARERAVVAALVCAGAVCQAGYSTWYHYYYLDRRTFAGHHGAADEQMRMVFASRTGWLVYNRCRMLCNVIERPGEILRWAVHPLNAHPALDVQLFGFLAHSETAHQAPEAFLGYDWAAYCHFLADDEQDRIALLIISANVFRADANHARMLTNLAWSYVDQGGAKSRCVGPAPPPDPFILDRIRERYGMLETYSDPHGEVWILIRKDLWQRTGSTYPMSPLPRASDFPPGLLVP
ncbi:MAG: hypothetical protein HY814_11545 [Candidatus Riflebacteria bacterium]|nr:hypothetical protein [Candidatus Riflebacteria bacterium]